MFTALNWATYFEHLLPENIVGVTLVLENGCDDPVTYTINGNDVVFEGAGDLHDGAFSHMQKNASLEALDHIMTVGDAGVADMNFDLDSNGCPFSIRVYPSQAFYDNHKTSTPLTITFAVAAIFVFTAVMFLLYDRLVEWRQGIIMSKATNSTALLDAIYPKNIRDKLLEDEERNNKKNGKKGGASSEMMSPNYRLKTFLKGDEDGADPMNLEPLADLFPHT